MVEAFHPQGGEAGEVGRLQDNSVPSTQRRACFPAEQHIGEIERQDGADRAQGVFGD